MNAIPPTRLIRRLGAKTRWHIDAHPSTDSSLSGRYSTMCGQTIKPGGYKMVYDAKEIACTDCLIAAVRARRAER